MIRPSYDHRGGLTPLLGETIGQCLRRIASDLHDAPLATGTAELVCSDARC